VGTLAALCATLVVPASVAAPINLTDGATATASSTENATVNPAQAAIDNDMGTRWSSQFTDNEWLQIDLGQTATLDRIELHWEAAYASAYDIEVSADANTWTPAASVADGTGGHESVDLGDAVGRYVRVAGIERATGYGYALWEVDVFGTSDGATDPGPGPDPDPGPGAGACSTENIALGKTATASSSESVDYYPASAAFDGNPASRWASTAQDNEWLQVDLGSSASVCAVELEWEAAYGSAFDIQISDDAQSWTTLANVTNGSGGSQRLDVEGTGRYVRLTGITRGTGYGYSLWEMAVYAGDGNTDPSNPPAVETGGDLGPNVYVFDESTPTQDIQVILDSAFEQQETDQFGEGRYQFLFKPGTYPVHAHVGYYTSVSGAGKNPDDVNITGGVWADAEWFGGNATQNFWRSMENLKITPSTGDNRWAVSQAAPMRRIHVDGALSLHSSWYGWASGGYMADSKVEGQVNGYTQQQWYTRDSTLAGGWDGTLWNMTYSGVVNAPAQSFPDPAVTTLEHTGVIREKPYLYWDEVANDWAVFVPELRDGTRGITWENGSTAGTSLPLDTFYVAQPDHPEELINAALDQGLNVLFTPGNYRLKDTIRVTHPNTVVMGLGYATIIPEAGQTGMTVADVDGVTVASVLFDAGEIESDAMLVVGTEGSTADHSANPTALFDVFVRVGGAVAGKTVTSLEVNSNDTIIDHIWLWRGDHGEGIGWDLNTADYGLIVNGDDVSGYGLFVEHYQKYNTIWNGERGRTIFYQNELPYDPPSIEDWTHDGIRGYAAYKVADHVTEHEAWGLGSYCVFTSDGSITVDNAFEVPDVPGVKMHSLLAVSLGGVGTYANVINGFGPSAQGQETVPAQVTYYSNGSGH
jgi:hypothetical protein